MTKIFLYYNRCKNYMSIFVNDFIKKVDSKTMFFPCVIFFSVPFIYISTSLINIENNFS